MYQKILFICTGNYYRSRFAEALFNFHAENLNLTWRAFSRGLQIDLAPPGLSPHTTQAMDLLRIPLHYTAPERQSLSLDDLHHSHRAIALKRIEHYPMMREQFPTFADQIEYWDVHDIDFEEPPVTLDLIGKQVSQLLASLR
jgi:protein-tyrosine phosphatase